MGLLSEDQGRSQLDKKINEGIMIEGFSKMSFDQQLKLVASQVPDLPNAEELLRSFWHSDRKIRETFSHLSENTVSNFYLPYNIAPNFLINGEFYLMPMVTEESSVVAAAAYAAKFWARRGGFSSSVIEVKKYGQIHFTWTGKKEQLDSVFDTIKRQLRISVEALISRMEARGGGIVDFQLRDFTASIPGYFQLLIGFRTADSMGANFINSCLEGMASALEVFLGETWPGEGCEIIMSILSNYNPQCLTEVSVECEVSELAELKTPGSDVASFADKFKLAVDIAGADPYRAVTHNKGIMNGVDAVVLATGNDFRAVEAGAHAYASREGVYTSLSSVEISDGRFRFGMKLPLTLGTVGGLTSLHPLAEFSLHLLGKPSAEALMMITACAGLASNFAAVRSLTTTGIQKGHMKMHLSNMLAGIHANEEEKSAAIDYFSNRIVSYSLLLTFIESLRSKQK
jgi:hydroxymethylglutaryl-CoA reductase